MYLLTVKAALGEHAENMTLKDALWIVEGILPRRELTDEEKIAIILENHANRERSRRIRLEAQLNAMELEGIVVRDAFFKKRFG